VPEEARGGWFQRLKRGLSRSASKIGQGVAGIFAGRNVDDATLDELEELLISADLGAATAAALVARLRAMRFEKDAGAEEVVGALADAIAELLAPVAKPLAIDPALKPHTVLVAGVNGTGKTTTIGKLAAQWRAEGKSVMLAAGDTFRAAAVEQLKIWGARAGCPVIARDEMGADAAGLAFDAYQKAKAEGADVLIIDTAGRLQNKSALMDELKKIIRVMRKVDASAPHSTLLVLDATTGQNAHSQVEVFREAVEIDGLILTKLDSSAKGGVLVALAERFQLPVHAIGVGEGLEDLRPFEAASFARLLLGMEA
jgi:fused signal recognition particle receptor